MSIFRLTYLAVILIFAGYCTNNSEFEEHTNPLDTIFDDSNYRVVLSPPKLSGTTYTIAWSDVKFLESFRDYRESFNRSEWKLVSGSLLRVDGEISTADIDKILAKEALTIGTATGTYVAVSSVTESGSNIEGSQDITSEMTSEGSYVIELEYTHGSDSVVRMHSNVVIAPR